MLKFDNIKDIPKGVTTNMISVQEVIDILSAIKCKLPEGRRLNNVPFAVRLSNGRYATFKDEFKDKLILLVLGNSYCEVLNLFDTDAFIIETKSDFYKEFKTLKEENEIMKNKLSKIALASQHPLTISEWE